MHNAHIAFYIGKKALNPKATLIDKFICWVDGSDYSHAELVLSIDKNGFGDCISSSNRDDGVRRKQIHLLDGRWVLMPVEIDKGKALSVYAKYKGAGYDYMGLGSTKWSWFPNVPNRVYCTEFIAKMLGKVDAETWGVKRLYDHMSFLSKDTKDGR